MKSFQDLESLIASASEDAAKFEKGNKTSGTRLRKKMQEVKKLAQAVREEVSETKNAE